MPANSQINFLLLSDSPAVVAALGLAVDASGARLEILSSPQAGLALTRGALGPALVLLDTELPGMDPAQWIAAAQGESASRTFPILVISDHITQDWFDRLAEGVIDDLIPHAVEPGYLRLRMNAALRAFHNARQLQQLRDAAAVGIQADPVIGLYNRPGLLFMLFRETDRVQRMHTSLSMIVFDPDDLDYWNSQLGSAASDDLLTTMAGRVRRLLRSYDLFGRIGKNEFLLALPGCTAVNAVMLAERIRVEVFSISFVVRGRSIRLSACFGISASRGRSPLVVMRDASQALELAKAEGPESIRCSSDALKPQPTPAEFLSPEEDAAAW